MVKEEFRKAIKELDLGYEPKIVIGISCGLSIPTQFSAQIYRIRELYDEIVDDMLFEFSKPINVSRNNVMVKFLIDYPYASHLLILDDDVIVPDDFIVRLLQTQKETGSYISSGLIVKKHPPHFPLALKKIGPNTYTSILSWNTRYVQVDSIGFGCVLIHRKVLQDISYPFCVSSTESEDYYFFEKCRLYGYTVIVDTELVCGHVGQYVYTISDFLKYKDVIRGAGVFKV